MHQHVSISPWKSFVPTQDVRTAVVLAAVGLPSSGDRVTQRCHQSSRGKGLRQDNEPE